MENANQATQQTKTLFDILAEEGEVNTAPGQPCPDKDKSTEWNELSTKITVPSLHEAAMLVSLSISVPSFTKLDRELSEEVARSKGADTDAFVGYKQLIRKEHLVPLSRVANAARNYNYANTVPWGDMGIRLLTNERLIEHRNEMSQFEKNYWAEANTILDKWDSLVMQSALFHSMGGMHKDEDYPTREQLIRKFGFRIAYEPVPKPGSVDDIRTNLPETVRDEMHRQYKEIIDARSKDIAQDVWKRLHEPLTNMSKMLVDKDEGKPTGFKSTLVDNVLKIVDLMKAFNLTDDPNMDRVRRELRDALTGVTYDKLKASDSLRAQTKEKVDKVVASVEQIKSSFDW